MKSAEKIAKLAAERGASKPCIAALSSKSAIRSRAAKRRWETVKAVTGPKPSRMVKLSRSGYYAVSKECDAIATRVQLYEAAWLAKQFSLCWQMREDVDNRLFGKPYTAQNPEDSSKSAVIYQDKRLQVAIQQLLPQNNQSVTPNVTPVPQLEGNQAVTDLDGGLDTHNTSETGAS